MTANPEAGPLAEEAAALVEAGLAWAQRAAAALGPEEHTCTACPLCRAVGALREPDPELAQRLTNSVTDLAAAVAAGLKLAFDRPHRQPSESADETPQSSPTGGLEHIDII